MSLSQVRTSIQKFVESSRNEFLLIKGGWGVGKTHFWQSLIKEFSENMKIGKPKYSYASLFGVDSLETLKNSIVVSQIDSNVVSKDVNTSFNFMWWKAKPIIKEIEKIPKIKGYTGGLVSEWAFLTVKDSLICFDDFERRSNKLEIKEILGLASFLKEQRNCKIVFISNEGTLSEKDTKEFKSHSEKLVDVEIQFAPTPEEAINYIFEDSNPNYELIKTSCLKLRIKNIRIIQRIKRFIVEINPYLDGIEEPLKNSVINSLILYVWIYYDKDNAVPDFSYVENYKFNHLSTQISGKKISEDEKKWNDLLEFYGYQYTDEIDKQLIAFVKLGYLDEEKLIKFLNARNEEIISHEGRQEFSKAWDLYRNSFENNEEEFLNLLVSSFRTNTIYLNCKDLDSVVEVLRIFGKDKLANELIDEYSEKPTFEQEANAVKNGLEIYEIKDKYLFDKVKKIWNTPKKNLNFLELIKKVTIERSFDSSDIESLSAYDEDAFYELLKSENSPELPIYVRTCLKLNEIAGDTDSTKEISLKIKKTLKKIASESSINKLRVTSYYGLTLDKNDEEKAE